MIPNSLSITTYGAVADGRDNWAAIQQTFDAAEAQGKPVWIPAGQWHYSTELKINGIKVYGEGEQSVLVGTTRTNMALIMKFNRPGVYNLKIVGPAGGQHSNWEACGIAILTATNFEVRGVTIERCGAAGIHMDGSSGGLVEYNTLRWTGRDSIHHSNYQGACHDIMVRHNRSENSGDDGVAVVSYLSNAAIHHHITVEHNTVVEQESGRGYTVVGGHNVSIRNNHYDNNKANFAGVYISAEAGWGTHGANNVWVEDNEIKNAGGNHGSIQVFAENNPVYQIYIKRNKIYASRNAPIVTNGSVQGYDIFLTDNIAYGTYTQFLNQHDGTVVIQSNNTILPLLDYPGDKIKPGFGVQDLQEGIPMVNTAAPRAIVTTNINDNTTGDISASDLRQVFLSTLDALDTASGGNISKGRIAGTISSLANRTYTIDLAAAFSYTIDSLVTQTLAGTCTVSVQVEGINVTGLNGIAATATRLTSNATGSRSVAANAKVTIVVSAVSGATELAYSLNYTRT